jgi:hypothetical protein
MGATVLGGDIAEQRADGVVNADVRRVVRRCHSHGSSMRSRRPSRTAKRSKRRSKRPNASTSATNARRCWREGSPTGTAGRTTGLGRSGTTPIAELGYGPDAVAEYRNAGYR